MSEFIEASGDSVEEAIDNALTILAAREDEVEIQIVSEAAGGRGGAKVRARIRDERSPDDHADDHAEGHAEGHAADSEAAEEIDDELAEAQADAAHDFIEGLLDAMGMDADVESEPERFGASVDILGPGLAVLIGKHGATLAAVQELTRAVVQKELGGRAVVRVDIEGYMARRRDSLERLAQNMAAKVRKTKRPIDLEPMPARDRKIIHDALTRATGIKTSSEGQEPFRYVVISPA